MMEEKLKDAEREQQIQGTNMRRSCSKRPA